MSQSRNSPLLSVPVEIDLGPGFAALLALTIDALLQPPSASEVERMRQLLLDLEALRAGDAPSPEQLATAPLLSRWQFMLAPDGLCLAGEVFDHPLLGSRPNIRTSRLYVVGPDLAWARTFSRFFRLGPQSREPMAKPNRRGLH